MSSHKVFNFSAGPAILPEPVLLEVLHYLKFLTRTRAEEAWADVTPSREVEQEVLDLLDGKPK